VAVGFLRAVAVVFLRAVAVGRINMDFFKIYPVKMGRFCRKNLVLTRNVG
jgi:hypothetical protein